MATAAVLPSPVGLTVQPLAYQAVAPNPADHPIRRGITSGSSAPPPPAGKHSRYPEPRLEAWERRVDLALGLGGILFLIAYALPIIRPSLSGSIKAICDGMIATLWIAFIIDYLVRLYLARDKAFFFKHNLIDLLALALPVLRPLRLLRLVALVGMFTRLGAKTMRGRLMTYVTGGALLMVLVGGLAVTEAERDAPGATIRSFGTGLWWAVQAVTTVDFGEVQPVTTVGRLIAIVLMLTGVALVGSVTAVLASWLVEKVTDEEDPDSPATAGEISKLVHQIENLETKVDGLAGGANLASASEAVAIPEGS